jgi:hypothetical protein
LSCLMRTFAAAITTGAVILTLPRFNQSDGDP